MRRKYIGIEAARRVLGDLALEAQQGTEIILTRGNSRTPIARIAPLEAPMTAPYTLISANTGDLVPGVELSDPDCPLAWDDLPDDAQEWAKAQGYDGEDDSELLYVLMDDDEDEGVPAGFPAYRVAPNSKPGEAPAPRTEMIIASSGAEVEDDTPTWGLATGGGDTSFTATVDYRDNDEIADAISRFQQDGVLPAGEATVRRERIADHDEFWVHEDHPFYYLVTIDVAPGSSAAPDSLDRDLVVAIVAGPHRDVLDFAATGTPLPSVETDELWEWIAEHEADGTNDDRWVALSFGFIDNAIAARTVRLTEEEAALLHAEVERDEAERADD